MRLAAVAAFRLTTGDPDRLSRFYAGLGFAPGEATPIPAAEIALLGVSGSGVRRPLRCGEQRLDIDCFEIPGRPYPENSSGADLIFQHFALVTDDAAAAWARAEALGARPISRGGPVTLPDSAGGVTAAKFRDPDGHPLEWLQFPPGAATTQPAIDHSAISVSDVAASRRFYESLGLVEQGRTLNQGPTQAALDGLPGVVVDVVPMVAARRTPHLELLGYRSPRGRAAPRLAANDVAATRVVWLADQDGLLRDPDGHLHQLQAG